MSHAEITRKFHPIGQGAFYSEHIDNGDRTSNIVYDCGVDCVQESNKAIVLDAFSKKDTIDFLFISHLDKDHISLVKTLKDSVLRINHVVLPLIDPSNVKVLYSLSSISGDLDVSYFWGSVWNAINGQVRDENSPRFFFIIPEGIDSDLRETQWIEPRPSGEPVSIHSLGDKGVYWTFIPFCQHLERRTELDERLRDLLVDPDFCSALSLLKIKCDSLEDLKALLATEAFADLEDNSIIRKKLHDAYSSITGTINQNSLLVYSGPDSFYDKFTIKSYFPWYSPFVEHCFFYDYIRHRVACLYTGDSDLDMFYYQNHLAGLWENVGTIQLPHHGSHASFNGSYNKNKFNRHYLFPVSFGEKNRFHHPSGKVLSFLLRFGCLPVPVTDDYHSMFQQIIVLDNNVTP